jgi:hypothetical protein
MVMTLSDETRADFAATYEQIKLAPCGSGPAAELDALHTALIERVPLLGACLIQWG